MPLLWRERRGPEWKQGWAGQTLSSASFPPLPLLTIFAIVLLFLSLSHYADYREKMHYRLINFKLILLLVPVALILITRSMISNARIAFQLSRFGSISQAGSSPWVVALLVLFLIVMISYKSSFDSQWF